MNRVILNIANQEFIDSHINDDIHTLLFKSYSGLSVNKKLLVEQIESKKKCQLKLPTWFHGQNIYFPNKLSIEQTSSEITAAYKAKLVQGSQCIDLTGGFGVDCYYFAQQFEYVEHCEINNNLAKIAAHNFEQLGVKNVKVISDDGMSYLKLNNQDYDCIYIDPSRRHDVKGKVFYLNDCIPNVPEQLDLLLKYSNTLLIKASPMLDISVGISELKYVKSIHVVAVNNDVKELLFLIEKNYSDPISIQTANIKGDNTSHFSFLMDEEHHVVTRDASPTLKYLYEPNAAILKSGGFKSVGQQFGLIKVHQHSHLYLGDNLIEFPGRRFSIIKVIPYNKKEVFKHLKNKKCHITTRNFPSTVAQLKSKFKTKDGGDLYVFFTTNHDNKKVAIFTNKA